MTDLLLPPRVSSALKSGFVSGGDPSV